MSRKDYCLVAVSIKQMVVLQTMGNSGLHELVTTMCQTFKADNPAFRADIFRSACGLEE
jgi:hypothetical protein